MIGKKLPFIVARYNFIIEGLRERTE